LNKIGYVEIDEQGEGDEFTRRVNGEDGNCSDTADMAVDTKDDADIVAKS
jgi:hypothetical protein